MTDQAEVPRNGTPALVHFWASWCRPCIAELPDFLVFQRTVGSARAVAVSEDFKQSTAEQFLFDRGLDMPSGFDRDSQLLQALGGGQVLPYTVLVDGRGQVVETWTGKTDWAAPELYEKLQLSPSLHAPRDHAPSSDPPDASSPVGDPGVDESAAPVGVPASESPDPDSGTPQHDDAADDEATEVAPGRIETGLDRLHLNE